MPPCRGAELVDDMCRAPQGWAPASCRPDAGDCSVLRSWPEVMEGITPTSLRGKLSGRTPQPLQNGRCTFCQNPRQPAVSQEN